MYTILDYRIVRWIWHFKLGLHILYLRTNSPIVILSSFNTTTTEMERVAIIGGFKLTILSTIHCIVCYLFKVDHCLVSLERWTVITVLCQSLWKCMFPSYSNINVLVLTSHCDSPTLQYFIINFNNVTFSKWKMHMIWECKQTCTASDKEII